ncbi:CDP-glycerol glycerophosphotransferase family protein [Virgibacillus sp. NKC19-3]|uniref:CDP-glycerol glycerophosphotransferase family protein n=1 Tax=Virgibacillus saliphilus TaxID=2831674 RepID=UPI001C9B0756|nr:CDP-glycerol glycerophosphotransferase family protein [Virgibacillus sp. NKC19-3]MBY7144659.1 CDP-glycerol glycerophosphotransferase family protein [Virgibacillus sp. NKC19-3]
MKSETKNIKKGHLNEFFDLLPRFFALKVYTKRNNIEGIYRNLQKLKPLYKRKTAYYLRLAELAYELKKWEQSLDYINIAIQLEDDHTSKQYYLLKADCLIRLDESAQAAASLNEYLSANPNDAKAWHKLADQYSILHQWKEAANSFESYLKQNPKDSSANFQLAESYRKLRDWQEAEINYRQSTKNLDNRRNGQPLAISYYRLGLMQLKNNKDEQAFKSFNEVISLDKELNSERFGIGVFHEHYKQWEYAIKAYKSQLQEDDTDAELYFKLASLLDKLYRPEQALQYYEKALELDKVRSPWHFALASCYEQLKDYKNAAKWYESAIARQEKHRPGNYRRLGFVLDKLGRNKESLEAYKEAELFRRPSTINEKLYKKNITKPEVRYATCYEHYPLNENIILYRSSGARLTDNPYAIFKYIMNDINFKDYIHVWIIDSFKVIPDELKSKDNIIFVKKGSDASRKYMASAKYLICNSKFEDYFVRRPNQLYLQTSHGIFYKTMGRDQVRSSIGSAGGTHNLLQATHLIMPNDYMVKKQPRCYSTEGINSGQIAKIGYPRIDTTLNASKTAKRQMAVQLGLDPSKKTVFYAPTWRGSLSNKKMDSTKLIEDLNMLAKLDINMVFRGHTFSNKLLKDIELPSNIIVPPAEIQTNELLSIADTLITDYSSVFFDFLATERPIIHYIYDIEEYKKERGLNLAESELPGSVVKTSDQLVAGVADSLKNNKPDSHYLAAKRRFCPYDDGNSTQRIINWFFYGNSQDINIVNQKDNTESWLYLGGMLNNKSGIFDLVTKLNELKKNGNTVSIILEKKLTKNKDKLSMLKELRPDINLVPHDGKMLKTLEEVAAINFYQQNGSFANKEMEITYKNLFIREARRLFGSSKFDQIINFEDDSYYWSALNDVFQNYNDQRV